MVSIEVISVIFQKRVHRAFLDVFITWFYQFRLRRLADVHFDQFRGSIFVRQVRFVGFDNAAHIYGSVITNQLRGELIYLFVDVGRQTVDIQYARVYFFRLPDRLASRSDAAKHRVKEPYKQVLQSTVISTSQFFVDILDHHFDGFVRLQLESVC